MRNRPNQAGALPEAANATKPGGAAGVPTSDAEKALEMPARTVQKLEPRPDVKVKRFRIMNGGVIMYANSRTTIRAGKVITPNDYDLDKLRAQGIVLKEIEDEQPAAAAQ